MGRDSAIEWTDHTFNPWLGCTHVHAGCTNCYAEEMMDSRYGKVAWGPASVGGTRVMTSRENWNKPCVWDRAAAEAGKRAKVFCASLADVFEDWDGPIMSAGKDPVFLGKDWRASGGKDRATLDDVRRKLFELIDATPHLDWLLLTKRPENVRRMWPKTPQCNERIKCNLAPTRLICPDDSCDIEDGIRLAYRPNVWLGTSVSDQASANRQIPELLRCGDLCPIRFLSCEPLLGPLDIDSMTTDPPNSGFAMTDGWGRWDGEGPSRINWVIVGGESGHGARPMHPQWVWDLRRQCHEASVPFFFKQWGEWCPTDVFQARGDGLKMSDFRLMECGRGSECPGEDCAGCEPMFNIGKKAAGRLLDGRTWDEWPAVAEVPA